LIDLKLRKVKITNPSVVAKSDFIFVQEETIIMDMSVEKSFRPHAAFCFSEDISGVRLPAEHLSFTAWVTHQVSGC
jgi:hypothetical protein